MRRAADVFAQIRTETLSQELGTADDAATQVFVDGNLAAASPNVADEPPLTDEPGFRTWSSRAIDEDEVRVLDRGRSATSWSTSPPAPTTSTRASRPGPLPRVAVPVLTLALGLGSWWLIGRTLRPAVAAAARASASFVGDAAHELRSPLTRMRTELEVDLAHPAGADPLATHRSVLDEVVGLQRLVDDLLQLARGVERRRERVDLVAIARAARRRTSPARRRSRGRWRSGRARPRRRQPRRQRPSPCVVDGGGVRRRQRRPTSC